MQNNQQKLDSLSREQLQLLLKRRAEKGAENRTEPMRMQRNVAHEYVLSNSQQQFWFMEQLDGEQEGLHNNPVYGLLDFGTALDISLFEKTFQEIIRRHEIFRTFFISKAGVPYQKIVDEVNFSLNYEDVRSLPEAEKRAYMQHAACGEAAKKISLDKAPLMNMRLIRISETSYLFLYTPHHIISDGWTNAQFMKEFAMIYMALRQNAKHSLPQPACQYVDYVAWEKAWLQSDACKESIAYWKQAMSPLPDELVLPHDRAVPGKLSHRGKMTAGFLGKELTGKINQYCQENGFTPFQFFLAALDVLLFRYSHQSDIVVGIPVANRNVKEYQDVLGLVMNTLPYRTKLAAGDSFRSVVSQVKEVSDHNLKHQHLPFDILLSQLSAERSWQASPLFRVLFVFQNIPSLYAVGHIRIDPYKIDLGVTKSDLNFWVEEYGGEFNITLTACTDLFSEGMMERIMEHYRRVLQSAVRDASREIGKVDFLTEKEKQLIFRSRETAPAGRNVKDWFESVSRNRPDQVAVESGGKFLTYRQLEIMANRLAHFLQANNKEKKPVAIAMKRSVEMIVGLLGVVKSGAPYVPVDPNQPQERIDYILNDSQSAWVITEEKLQDILAVSPQTGNPSVGIQPEDPVYIIYTSGTTGKPKGVIVSHRAIANYVSAVNARIGFQAGERYATVSTIAADLGNTMIFPSLLNGGMLWVATEAEILSPELLAKRFRQSPPDHLKIVPSHLQALLKGGEMILPRKNLIFGGESLSIGLVKQIRGQFPSLRIHNHYGPTEATIGVTTCLLTGNESEIPIGKPLDNVYIYLLDDHLSVVPVGVEGEIYIGGACLANAYLHQESLTREKFVDDPYTPGKKLFKTGDRGFLKEDGAIVFRGRNDRQVKIRGNRVELREIELQLEALDGVQQAVALIPSEKTNRQLWAMVHTVSGRGDADYRALLSERMPAYMVPVRIVQTDRLPVTPNGKIDYDAVAERIRLARQAEVVPEKEAAPLTGEEKQVRDIFCKVLKTPAVNRDDSFFEIGGNSLSAIELLYSLNRCFQTDLSLSFLFRHASVQKIVEGLHERPSFASLVKIKEGNGRKALFLVHPAGGNIFCYHTFSDRMAGDTTIYGLQSQPGKIDTRGIRELARHYLDEVEKCGFGGELIFGGWSMGALTAYEMAVEWSKEKGQCPPVLVIDQMAYALAVSGHSDDNDRIALFAEKVEHLIGHPLGITREKLQNLSPESRSLLFLDAFKRDGLVPQSVQISDFHGFLEQMIVHNEQVSAYRPSRYEGKVIVVRSEEALLLKDDTTTYSLERPDDLLWREFAGQVVVVTSPGNHVSMMRPPYVEVLARRVQEIL